MHATLCLPPACPQLWHWLPSDAIDVPPLALLLLVALDPLLVVVLLGLGHERGPVASGMVAVAQGLREVAVEPLLVDSDFARVRGVAFLRDLSQLLSERGSAAANV